MKVAELTQQTLGDKLTATFKKIIHKILTTGIHALPIFHKSFSKYAKRQHYYKVNCHKQKAQLCHHVVML
jgi:hypothetical protein